MRCYQFVCFFVLDRTTHHLTLITFTDFNLELPCILDQTFFIVFWFKDARFPHWFRRNWQWKQTGQTVTPVLGVLAGKLSNWTDQLTAYTSRYKKQNRQEKFTLFVYSTRVVKRCMLLCLKTPTSGVMTLFWTIKRQNSWQITRSSCILKPLRNYHFFSKITYLILSLCFSRFYSSIHFNVAGSLFSWSEQRSSQSWEKIFPIRP